MGKRVILVFMFLGLLPGWGLPQNQDQDQDQGSSSGERSRSQGQQRRQDSRFRRPLFLSGKVVLDDGEPPAVSTQVELICQGTTIEQVFTSGEGSFSFQINLAGSGPNKQLPIDESIASSPFAGGLDGARSGSNSSVGASLGSSIRYDSVNLSTCELTAKLAGFRSDKIRLGPGVLWTTLT